MANYITVDGGTTNTRLYLVRDGRVVDSRRYAVGARDAMVAPALWPKTVAEGIVSLLEGTGLPAQAITAMLASGMITGEYGLQPVTHLPMPAGIRELHEGLCRVNLPAVSAIPFWFIPGVKKESPLLEETDMMRGEETEIIGLAAGQPGIYVLPGSHSKIITVDGEGRITHSATMLTGEMLAALSQGTILKGTVDMGASLNPEALIWGFDFCREQGLNSALFKTRILSVLRKRPADEVYSFFMGAVMQGEITAIACAKPEQVTVMGKPSLCRPTALLLHHYGVGNVTEVEEPETPYSVMGAIKIAEYGG